MHTSKVSTWSVHTRFPASASYWGGWKGHETHSADEAYGQRSQFSAVSDFKPNGGSHEQRKRNNRIALRCHWAGLNSGIPEMEQDDAFR